MRTRFALTTLIATVFVGCSANHDGSEPGIDQHARAAHADTVVPATLTDAGVPVEPTSVDPSDFHEMTPGVEYGLETADGGYRWIPLPDPGPVDPNPPYRNPSQGL